MRWIGISQNTDFSHPLKYKEIVQEVFRIKIRWPFQKQTMMRAFKFHRLNAPKGLMCPRLIPIQCHLAFVADVLPLCGQQRALWRCWHRIPLAHCVSISPRKEALCIPRGLSLSISTGQAVPKSRLEAWISDPYIKFVIIKGFPLARRNSPIAKSELLYCNTGDHRIS